MCIGNGVALGNEAVDAHEVRLGDGRIKMVAIIIVAVAGRRVTIGSYNRANSVAICLWCKSRMYVMHGRG